MNAPFSVSTSFNVKYANPTALCSFFRTVSSDWFDILARLFCRKKKEESMKSSRWLQFSILLRTTKGITRTLWNRNGEKKQPLKYAGWQTVENARNTTTKKKNVTKATWATKSCLTIQLYRTVIARDVVNSNTNFHHSGTICTFPSSTSNFN